MTDIPVAEIFGPTIQGEGVEQGAPCAFIRVGGCDYKCSWCDTPHAVLPQNVRTLERLTPEEIVDKVEAIVPSPPWVIISGGNPAIYDLGELVSRLKGAGFLVAVETQASRFQPWFTKLDRLCLSPKPPSSGMMPTGGSRHQDHLLRTLETIALSREIMPGVAFLKVVVFDDLDLDWAKELRKNFPEFELYLSAGNDAGKTVGNPDRVDHRTLEDVRNDLLERSTWLTEKVLADPELCSQQVVVQAQHHVLLWGNRQGV